MQKPEPGNSRQDMRTKVEEETYLKDSSLDKLKSLSLSRCSFGTNLTKEVETLIARINAARKIKGPGEKGEEKEYKGGENKGRERHAKRKKERQRVGGRRGGNVSGCDYDFSW